MHKRIQKTNITDYRAVSTEQLADMIGVGIGKAEEIGRKAHARIKVGRRVIWNVSKVQAYLDKVSE